MSGPPAVTRHRILIVDDEPHVVRGATMWLRRHYEVHGATSAREALSTLEEHGPFAAVLTDLRMPGMDGLAFLVEVRRRQPDAVRMLLTGHADVDTAVDIVNEAGVFRFLVKPCPRSRLLAAFKDAVAQYELVTAERVLLEQTLRGAVEAMNRMLGLANPAVAGRAERIRRRVRTMAQYAPLPDVWAVEVAAMLGQLGLMTLPDETIERIVSGRPLGEEDRVLLRGVPHVSAELITAIPRLEHVRDLIETAGPPASVRRDEGLPADRGAAALRLAIDFEELFAAGVPPAVCVATLRERHAGLETDLIDALALAVGTMPTAADIVEIPLREVREGMVFTHDVRSPSGALLVARGYPATSAFVARVANLPEQIGSILVRVAR